MQLLILALMMMAAGKNANMKELEPILQSFGGEEAAEAFKKAEEISGVLTAVQSLTSAQQHGSAPAPEDCGDESACVSDGFPLAPVAGIADERITYGLSKYIACGE